MNNILVFKNPLPGEPNLTYDLSKIRVAQQRASELAYANPHRAPELLSIFVDACFELGDIYGDLQYQTFVAERKVSERRAVLMIDVIPENIRDKKLSQNTETRQALVDMDLDYQDRMLVYGSLHAGLALIKEKLRAMEGALGATKKVLDDTLMIYRRGGNQNLGKAYDPSLEYDDTNKTAVDNAPIAIGKASYGGRKNG